MAIPLSIHMLRRKRNEIRDAIANYEAKLREARADLAHVLATLRMFEASGEPADFAPYFDLNRVLARGETTDLCIAFLKAEGPLDTRQLTQRIMEAKGLDASDKVLGQAIALRVVQTLRVRAKRRKGIDGSLRRRGVCVWRLLETVQPKQLESPKGEIPESFQRKTG
ncbi:MAG TPA: hypothetical protein VMU22_00010 [Rhizomicrobium sp.]|nr:hypothetical protein [Rhizomicrobium sp.]